MKNFIVTRRFNGLRTYVSKTRSLNGGEVGAVETERKARAKRYTAVDAKRLAVRLNEQDRVGWNDWEVAMVMAARQRDTLERV